MLYPKANKTSLAKLIRAKGHEIPSIRNAVFETHGRAFWLKWHGPTHELHCAYYTGAGGRPVLQVDRTWHDLTMAEVIQYGLVEEK